MTTNRTRRTLEGSIVVSLARQAWSGSSVLAAIQSSIARTQSIGSAFLSVLPATPLSQAAEDSAVAEFARSTETAARASFCYRWLTADPEPEVIVIDLRKTYTVGPVIALLDRLVSALMPAYGRSRLRTLGTQTAQATRAAPVRTASLLVLVGSIAVLVFSLAVDSFTLSESLPLLSLLLLAALGTRSTRSWEDLRDTRTVQLVIAALEPLEPVENTAPLDDEAPDTPDRPE